jgi:hypothetical protein
MHGILYALEKCNGEGGNSWNKTDDISKTIYFGNNKQITFTDCCDLLVNQTPEFMEGFVEMITPTFKMLFDLYDGDTEFDGVDSMLDIIKDEYVSKNSIVLEKFKNAKPKIYFASKEDEFEIRGFNDFFSSTLKYIYEFVKQEFPYIDTTRKIAF